MMTHNKFNQHARKPGESDEDFFERNLAEVDRRATEGMPFFWTGLHSSLAGANDTIPLPLIGEHPDWELELGVIIGKTGRYLKSEEAGDLIADYVMVNDIGTVDEFRRTDVRFMFDWVYAGFGWAIRTWPIRLWSRLMRMLGSTSTDGATARQTISI